MATNTTQSAVNPGASNASDFQPGTQNPQSAAPATLLPSATTGLQSGDQDQVLENKDARITVPTVAPAKNASPTTTSNGNGLTVFWIGLVVVVLGLLFLWRWFRRSSEVTGPSEVTIPEDTVTAVVTPKPKVTAAPKPKKPVPKKSKSQRKKRARR